MRSNETVYLSGSEYFAQLFTALDHANSEILIESYIFKKGELAQTLLEKLRAARLRGVQIKITVDAAGSYGETAALQDFCLKHQIKLRVFHPILWSSLMKSLRFLNRRNHRKVCHIDGVLAFTGSLNISDEHILENATQKPWKDYGISFQGEGVAELRTAFEKVFNKFHANNFQINKEHMREILFQNKANNPQSGIFLNDTLRKRRECARNFKSRIQTAQKRIWLANAYILPEFKIQKHLEAAALRGVDVRILTSGSTSDVFFMPWLMRLYYQRNLKAGIKLYEYLPTFFHGKVFILDDFVSIGSSNLNHRSVFHDLELDVKVEDEANKLKVSEDIEKCLSESRLISKEDLDKIPLWQMLLAKALYLFKYWF